MQARQLVQERLALAASRLPSVAHAPVILVAALFDQPLAENRDVVRQLSQMEMTDLARWTIRPRLMAVPGVANVAIWGERDRQYPGAG